ncbi:MULTISPECIES: hypothetical protein [unclassified Sedimentibacter]|uniref:lysine 5,6-aminomutase reactivase subunit KamB n=1 Tax=unclassified Sedimentibacter TaxID=2649220 RepID=UPI0027DFEA1C|nr:hypothetical protein [Sedimentibacter sp. MB35-C1]WMJ78047.1 hypothetical protein RBQ61_03720 [Sedimentibacter sp. MB35-C1]
MGLIESIKKNKYKTVSIVGLAKNAGKTVALNYLIGEAENLRLNIGITSAGRDGENLDLVTQTQKPSIFVTEGMYVATAKKTFMLSDAKAEILETTGISTPMGEVIIVRIRQSGNMQIAGPVSVTDMKYVSGRLKHYGAKVVFIDGAIDRKAASSPVISDACIIATGAVLSRDIKKVAEKTAHAVECMLLKQTDDGIRKIIFRKKSTCIIQNTGDVIVPDIKTSITGGKKINDLVDEKTTHVFIKGAVTTSLLRDIGENKYLRGIKIVIEDGTKVFTDINVWNELKRKGLKAETLNTINVIAVTLNPVSPVGYFFDSVIFKSEMEKYLPEVKIIDVVAGGDLE